MKENRKKEESVAITWASQPADDGGELEGCCCCYCCLYRLCVSLLFFLRLLLLSVHRRRHSFPITQRAKQVAVTADSLWTNITHRQQQQQLRIGSTLVGWTGKFESLESVVCVRAIITQDTLTTRRNPTSFRRVSFFSSSSYFRHCTAAHFFLFFFFSKWNHSSFFFSQRVVAVNNLAPRYKNV